MKILKSCKERNKNAEKYKFYFDLNWKQISLNKNLIQKLQLILIFYFSTFSLLIKIQDNAF